MGDFGRYWLGLALVGLFTFHANAAEFHYWQSLQKLGLQELFAAKVATYPDWYQTQAHLSHDGEWLIDAPLSEVWQFYLHTPMRTVWTSEKIKYGFSVGPDHQAVIDESKWPGLEVGTRFYLDILAEPTGYIWRIGFGIEITEIQPEKLIKYEYLDFSPAYGEQWLTFEAVGEQQTRVRFLTRYLGKDRLMDYQYMSYHQEAISSFQNSVKKIIETTRGHFERLPTE